MRFKSIRWCKDQKPGAGVNNAWRAVKQGAARGGLSATEPLTWHEKLLPAAPHGHPARHGAERDPVININTNQ